MPDFLPVCLQDKLHCCKSEVREVKTGKDLGSNGEFIHGNNNPASIGTYASHGCIRMDNDVIVQLSKEVKPGSYVLIQK